MIYTIIINPFEQFTLEQLRTRTSEKWCNYDFDVLPLWVAEMDVKPPQVMVDKICKTITDGDLGYLSQKGFKNYAQAFCNWTKRHWGWEHDPKLIADTIDVVSGCKQVINAYLEHNPMNTVIISTPIYPPFINSYTKGYNFVDVPLSLPNYRLDYEKLEETFKNIATGTRAVYCLCNPQNPTGTVFSREELTKLAKLAEKYNVLVLSDEIHQGLVMQRNSSSANTDTDYDAAKKHRSHSAFVPYLSIPEANFAVTVSSASKSFSIAGMKSALIIPSAHSSNKAIDLIWKSGEFRQGSSEQLGAFAQTICMNECDEWLDELVKGIQDNYNYCENLIKEHLPLVKYVRPQGTYFLWLDFSGYGLENPSQHFIKNAKVALNPGRSFATLPQFTQQSQPQSQNKTTSEISTNLQQTTSNFDSFVRLNYATNQEILKMCFENIAKSL